MGRDSVPTKEAQDKLVENIKRWQKIENAAVASTGRIIESTGNPIVRLVMEIIQRDSQMHFRVQETIAASLETQSITLSPDEMGRVWEMIEKHIELEKETVALAQASLSAIKGRKGMVVQKYLLEYLLADEQKHNDLLSNLESLKSGMYPYG